MIMVGCQKEALVVPQTGGCVTTEVENWITNYDTIDIVTPSGDTIIVVSATEIWQRIVTEVCPNGTTTSVIPLGSQDGGQWSNYFTEWHLLANPYASGWDGLTPTYCALVEEYIDGYDNYGRPVWKRTGLTERGLVYDGSVRSQISGYFGGAVNGRMAVMLGGYISDFDGWEIVGAYAPAQLRTTTPVDQTNLRSSSSSQLEKQTDVNQFYKRIKMSKE